MHTSSLVYCAVYPPGGSTPLSSEPAKPFSPSGVCCFHRVRVGAFLGGVESPGLATVCLESSWSATHMLGSRWSASR